MKSLGQTYYAGLLSAAQYHGAAHHRPQEFQVFLAKNRRPIQCGKVSVAFMARKRITDVPVQSFNTPRGTILVSTPEATAIDLVGYQHHAGGLDQVATILSELVEKIDPRKLAAAAATAPVRGHSGLATCLSISTLAKKPLRSKPMCKSTQGWRRCFRRPRRAQFPRRDDDWNLYVNADVEAEI